MSYHIILKNKKAGFLVLTMVLLVGVIITAIAVGILLRSVTEMNESVDSEKSLLAWSVVNACGEYALGQLASTTDSIGWSYSGEETILVGDNSCYIYSIADGDLGSKFIMASSTVSDFTRKILIEVATNTPSLIVNSWKIVTDF